MDKLKILFVHHANSLGGAPLSMVKTIQNLNPTLYSVEVLLFKDSPVKSLLDREGIRNSVISHKFYKNYYNYFTHIEPYYIRWYQIHTMVKHVLIWLLSRYFFSYIVLGKYDYDIVHFNSSVLTDWLSAGKKFGKTIIHIREPLARGYLGFRKFVFRMQMKLYADTIIAISEDNANRVKLPKQTKVVYNFNEIDCEINKDGATASPRTAIYMGGGALIKGFLTMVESLDYLEDDIKIIFCGHFPKTIYETGNSNKLVYLKNKVKSLSPKQRNIEKALKMIRNHKNVEFIGFSTQTNTLLRRSSFLVNPFLVTHFSRPIIEAFSNKRTVVSTNVEGMNEIVRNGIDGLLVPRNNPKELAKSINWLCNNPELSMKMGNEGYMVAKKYFSEKNILKIQEIYDSYRKV